MRIRSLDDLPLAELIEIDINVLPDESLVPAVAAVHALYEMGMDDDSVRAYWRKIAYREAGTVRAFLENVGESRRENWPRHFEEFSTHVKERGEW
jgi:hypothetical protein